MFMEKEGGNVFFFFLKSAFVEVCVAGEERLAKYALLCLL